MPRKPKEKEPKKVKEPKTTKQNFSDIIGKKNDEVETPDWLKDALYKEHGINFDPCPYPKPEWDGLEVDWGTSSFINPPFSEVEKWLKKGVKEAKKGRKSVFLVTARVSAKYWFKYVYSRASEWYFLEGAVAFKGYPRKLPTPLAIVIYDPAKMPTKGTVEISDIGGRRAFRIKNF